MTPRHEVGDRNGIEYRLIKDVRGKWHAALNCSCIFGPHWSELGIFKTKTAAYASIDGQGDGPFHSLIKAQPS